MEWSATTVVTSYVSAQRPPVPFDYVFKLNAPSVLRKENTRILEAVNNAARSPTGSGNFHLNLKGTVGSSAARKIGVSSFSHVSSVADMSPPHARVAPQTHLSCAREVLDKKRRLAEKSQDKGGRMGRKRKIHAEGVEIRRGGDRPTKRQCDEKTRNVGLLSDVVDMELITCEIEHRKLPHVPSILTSYKRLLPLFQSPFEASALYDYRQGHNPSTLKGPSPPRKSRLSECYTALP